MEMEVWRGFGEGRSRRLGNWHRGPSILGRGFLMRWTCRRCGDGGSECMDFSSAKMNDPDKLEAFWESESDE